MEDDLFCYAFIWGSPHTISDETYRRLRKNAIANGVPLQEDIIDGEYVVLENTDKEEENDKRD